MPPVAPVTTAYSGTVPPAVAQQGPRGAAAAHAVDRAARMRRGAGHVEPLEGSAVAAQLGGRAEDELLVELVASAGEVAVDEARVLALGLPRGPQRPSQHVRRPAGREALELGLDAFGHS